MAGRRFHAFLETRLAEAVDSYVENVPTSEGKVIRACVNFGLMSNPERIYEILMAEAEQGPDKIEEEAEKKPAEATPVSPGTNLS
jgi:hypothetical protein